MPSRNKIIRTSKLTSRITIIIVYGRRLEKVRRWCDDNDKIHDKNDKCRIWKKESKIDYCTNYDKMWRNSKNSSCQTTIYQT